eukprot:NODE_935_length_1809_cov_27.785227_g822_i0.p2 GENE.NODE_935_length_1809_cov_27.785227_g822_i0~~NODE_935_length_1809_cov_27.785227_g822_i0.p2  ORF type:complete len:126 (-),score=8.33 NODE_935_length_1809_cov_27.785227_g822_i0:1320-1697(-)
MLVDQSNSSPDHQLPSTRSSLPRAVQAVAHFFRPSRRSVVPASTRTPGKWGYTTDIPDVSKKQLLVFPMRRTAFSQEIKLSSRGSRSWLRLPNPPQSKVVVHSPRVAGAQEQANVSTALSFKLVH